MSQCSEVHVNQLIFNLDLYFVPRGRILLGECLLLLPWRLGDVTGVEVGIMSEELVWRQSKCEIVLWAFWLLLWF